MADSKLQPVNIHKTKSSREVSRYKPHLESSLELISGLGLSKDSEMIDVCGEASVFPKDLRSRGFRKITVLGNSRRIAKASKKRVGSKAVSFRWLEDDVMTAKLKPGHYDLWYDGAVFNFLTDVSEVNTYVNKLKKTLKKGGYALIVRYSFQSFRNELGKGFELIKHLFKVNRTLFHGTQEILYCLYRKS